MNKQHLKEGNRAVRDTYTNLVELSHDFLGDERQINFEDSLYSYLNRCSEYDFTDGRADAQICEPIFINPDWDMVIVPILKRSIDLSGGRVEYIHFVSGKLHNGYWHFKVKIGHTESFSYVDNYPALSDVEIGMKVVRNLLLRDDIEVREIYNDKLFEGDLYVL